MFIFFSDHHPPLFCSPFAQKSFVAGYETKDTIEKIQPRERGDQFTPGEERKRESLHVCVVEATFDGVYSSVQQLTVQGSREERDGIGFGWQKQQKRRRLRNICGGNVEEAVWQQRLDISIPEGSLIPTTQCPSPLTTALKDPPAFGIEKSWMRGRPLSGVTVCAKEASAMAKRNSPCTHGHVLLRAVIKR